MKICNKCNKTFSDNDVFCDICGEKLSSVKSSVAVDESVGEGNKRNAKGIMIGLSVFLAVSVIINLVMIERNANANWNLRKVESRKESLEEENREYQKLAESIQEEKEKYRKLSEGTQQELTFYQTNIGLVGDDKEYYHKYGCEYFKGDFRGYNTVWAKKEGYKPCPKCFGGE